MQSRRIASTDAVETPLHEGLGYGVFRIGEPLSCKWRAYEPEQGRFDFTELSTMVEKVTSRGLKPMIMFGAPPDWAVDGELGPGQVPRVDAYMAMIERVAKEFKGAGMHYELWNEINYEIYWKGTMDQAVKGPGAGAPVIKAVDPTAIVYAPSVTSEGTEGAVWLDKYLAAGACVGCDALCYHPYVYPGEPERILDISAPFVEVMHRYGFTKLINTEFTWNAFRVGGIKKTYPEMMAPGMAAAYMIRSLISLHFAGAEQNFFFGLDEEGSEPKYAGFSCIALTDSQDRSKLLPAGQALGHFIGLMTGGTLSELRRSHPLSRANFVTADDRHGEVFWTADETWAPVDFSRFESGVDVFGRPITLSDDFAVTSSPVFLFSAPQTVD